VRYVQIRLFLLLLPLTLCPGAVPAADRAGREPSLDRLLDKLAAVPSYEDVALSPDGKAVAWVQVDRSRPDALTPDKKLHLQELGSGPGVLRRIGAGNDARSEHAPAWSPDSKWIAFLSDAEKEGQPQLYVTPASAKEARRLTQLNGSLAQPHWSPDGKLMAVLHTPGAQGPVGPTQPAQPEVGEVGEAAPAQRLIVVDVASGRQLATSPDGLHIHEYDWSPDGKELVAVASPAPGDDNWYLARLCAISAVTGRTRDILKPTMQIAVPRWSPDGQTIAFIGGLMSDEGANGGDVFTVPAAGGRPVNRTPGLKASASWLTWLPSSRRLVFAEHVDGGSGIASLDLDGDRITTLWTGPETIAAQGWGPALSLSQDGQVSALVRHSFQRPPEVWAGPIGKWERVTSGNGGVEPGWGQAESLHWKSDSWHVQGWLLYPRDYDANKRYPLVVSVHGGPASARRPAWPGTGFDLAVLAHEGYFVFFPNPRGSFGQGEAFTRANVKDFGHGDLRDILTGVDAVLKSARVDENRLGIAGWSYGGYMTMWAVTQTTRFRSAVAGAGIANWQSYYGQNGIDQWLLPYFGATVYDDPAVYARSSPIEFIKRVRTPTLMLVGERDAECPVPQSREFWHALRTRKVPTQLVVYPGEGHGINAPRHRRDVMRRTLRWLDQSLQPDAAPSAGKEK
jgi:dipeptidyl aminopeptidase/acylaminoacyl peptidase